MGTLDAERAADDDAVEADEMGAHVRVLCVDDDAGEFDEAPLVDALLDAGVAVERAHGIDALAFEVTCARPHLVFVDFHTGNSRLHLALEAAVRLRALPLVSPPVLIGLASHGLVDAAPLALAAGYDHCLAKPVDVFALEPIVQAAARDQARAALPGPRPS